MEKYYFWSLVRLIENDPIFQNESPREQMPVSLQLTTTLDRLGHYGNGSALKRSGIPWGVSKGTIVQFMHRCLLALEGALANVVQWPDQNEWSRISNEFAKMGFQRCVGLIDGMPGSCSDILCFQSSPLYRHIDDPWTFSNGEYLLSNNGYLGQKRVVVAFKYSSAAADPDKEDFNYCLAKTSVANEHCIGILKSRWHSLKEQKTQLKGPATSVWMIRQLECCVRLHNYVHNLHDDWTVKDEEIVIEDDKEVDNPDIGNNSITEGAILRRLVMAECLEIYRRPFVVNREWYSKYSKAIGS